MKRAVLAGRVSRGERQQDPENQLAPLRATAERRVFVVAGEVSRKLSAWDDDQAREFWAAVLAELDRTGADCLMVWSLDRLTRGGIEDAFQKIRELDHRGVAFYSLQEPFLSTVDPQTRELMLALLAWAAKLGQRARWGRGRVPFDSDVAEMRRLRAEGHTIQEVVAELGFGYGTVQRALAGKSNPPPPAGGPAPQAEAGLSSASGEPSGGRAP